MSRSVVAFKDELPNEQPIFRAEMALVMISNAFHCYTNVSRSRSLCYWSQTRLNRLIMSLVLVGVYAGNGL